MVVGINDLSNGMEPEILIDKTETLMAHATSLYPRAKVHYSEVLISPKIDTNTKEKTLDFNEKMKAICHVNNMNYIAHEGIQKDGSLFVDDRHALRKGAYQLAHNLEAAILSPKSTGNRVTQD